VGQASAPPPPPPIVQVLPAGDDALRMARDEHALLAALVRREADTKASREPGEPEAASATPAGGAAVKAAKPGQAELARRSQKPAQAAQGETQRRAEDAIQPPLAAALAPKPVAAAEPAPARDEITVARNDEEDGPLLARLKQIPSWFLPDNDRIFGEVPRPPMPVGEMLSLPLKATAVLR
jgi:hypothetical protein